MMEKRERTSFNVERALVQSTVIRNVENPERTEGKKIL